MREGKIFLHDKLAPLVDPSSLDTVLEYLSSFENVKESRDEMVLFLESCFGFNDNFSNIIETYIQMIEGGVISIIDDKQSAQSSSSNKPTQLSAKAVQFQPHSASTPPEARQKNKLKPNTRKNPKQQGERRGICGCMATHHPLFASCHACGRLHCSKESDSEGGDCVFCGAPLLVEVTSSAVLSSPLSQDLDWEACEKAYTQKDKLLVFDKECAKRTQVFDAQGDYYESSTWLSEDEQRSIDEREKARREAQLRTPRGRGRAVVSYDFAGRKTVKYEDAEEEKEELKGSPALSYSMENMALSGGSGSGSGEQRPGAEGIQGGSKAAALYLLLRNRIVQGQNSGD